jgi:hypothetical protein
MHADTRGNNASVQLSVEFAESVLYTLKKWQFARI